MSQNLGVNKVKKQKGEEKQKETFDIPFHSI